MQSLRQGKTSEIVIHKQGKKKVFSLKEHDEEFGKQEEIFCVCLPSASVWATSFDRKGRGCFETVWLQRSDHFLPLFLSSILSPSRFPLLHRLRTQTKLCSAWLFSALLWIPISKTKDEISLLYVLIKRGDVLDFTWIMMSCGNISATLKSSFPARLARETNTVTAILLFCVLNSSFGGFLLTQNSPHVHSPSLPSDIILGAVIPVDLAFQNKGYMFSVCPSEEDGITAGLANKQSQVWGTKAQSLPTSPQNCPSISFLFKFSVHTGELMGKQGCFKKTTCAPYAF